MTKTSIVNKEAFDSLAYYTISANNDSAIVNCPLIDEQGNLVAIAQRNVKKMRNKLVLLMHALLTI